MSSTNGTPITTSITMTDLTPAAANNSKGKGKAIDTAPPQQDMSMDEDEDSSDEETGAEDDVCAFPYPSISYPAASSSSSSFLNIHRPRIWLT